MPSNKYAATAMQPSLAPSNAPARPPKQSINANLKSTRFCLICAINAKIAMGKKAHQMILDALDALTAEDELAARKVIAADDAVDYDFNAIKH